MSGWRAELVGEMFFRADMVKLMAVAVMVLEVVFGSRGRGNSVTSLR